MIAKKTTRAANLHEVASLPQPGRDNRMNMLRNAKEIQQKKELWVVMSCKHPQLLHVEESQLLLYEQFEHVGMFHLPDIRSYFPICFLMFFACPGIPAPPKGCLVGFVSLQTSKNPLGPGMLVLDRSSTLCLAGRRQHQYTPKPNIIKRQNAPTTRNWKQPKMFHNVQPNTTLVFPSSP